MSGRTILKHRLLKNMVTEDMISQHKILTHLAKLYEEGKLQSITTETYQPINANNMKKDILI